MCVWPFIDSAPGGHTDLRPVSVEPVWHGGGHRLKFSLEKWPVAELLIKKASLPMLFYGKFDIYLIISSISKLFCDFVYNY